MPDIRSFFGSSGKKKETKAPKPGSIHSFFTKSGNKKSGSKKRTIGTSGKKEEDVKKRKIETPSEPKAAAEAATAGNTIPSPLKEKSPPTAGGTAGETTNGCIETSGEIPIDEFTTTEETKLSHDVLKERYCITYDPIKDACWKKGKKMPYLAVARMFDKVSSTTKRLEKMSLVANLMRSVIAINPELILDVMYLCVNEVAPPYAGLELGIGDTVIIKALSQSTGRNPRDVKAEYIKEGDLGLVAEKSRGNQKTMFPPPPLDVKGVFAKLKKVANTHTYDEKVRIMQGMFVSCKECESRFIIRHLQGKMRMGLAEQTVFAALARALAFTPIPRKGQKLVLDMSKVLKSPEKMHARQSRYTNIINQVFSEVPNYDLVIPALVKYGIEKLHQNCNLTPGIPIKAMLAKPTTGIDEILKRFANIKFTLEYKYDGERAQIHLLKNGKFRFFSRSAEDNTEKFPDLHATIKNYCKPGVTSFILDSEIVAWDHDLKQILPFQVLTTRKRKGVQIGDIKVQVCIYAFDCLYMNGESLIRKPFGERRRIMFESFNETEGMFMFADHKDTDDPEVIGTFLDESIKGQCEGLMVKTLWKDATYEPARRSHNWLKCKKDYLEGCGDSLDLVCIGAFYGTGKRTGKYGSFLVACYDDEDDNYQSICKIGTGFKDEDLLQHFNTLSKIVVPKKPVNVLVSDAYKCDVWFEPQQVWEVKCADLTISPQHLAGVGRVHEEKGIALRFPRFMRVREDKKPEEATNGEQVAEMYLGQANLGPGAGRPGPKR